MAFVASNCFRSEIINIIKDKACLLKHIHTSFMSCLSETLDVQIDAQTHHGNRKFYEFPTEAKDKNKKCYQEISKTDPVELMKYIEENVIGRDYTFKSPFGTKKVVYCDYTASGRSLKFIENFIQNEVLPTYGNTHTTTSVTSLQTTLFRHEARDIIRNAVNACEHDAVVFTGSGCTAAIHKLIHALNLQKPPVVFVSPYEHHSSLLPWRELKSKIITIKESSDGTIDLNNLEKQLKHYSNRNETLIGCFPVASNITGILVDEISVSALLHTYGALAFWDFATAAPYVEINMNPFITGSQEGLAYKDALFISPHKFIGGVGTPGILVAKKNLFKNHVPSLGGGGSVFFVTRKSHRYLKEIEMREEGGTPAIVESIRAGLVFSLKENVGSDIIMQKENDYCQKFLTKCKNISEICLLGSTSSNRLAIFSFLIRHVSSNLFLHHNYVCALLNDLFGIQARGGCACAGPYAQELLGINEEMSNQYEKLLMEDSRLDRIHLRRYHEYSSNEILRPGFIRLNIPYFINEDEVNFIISAVELVAKEGWKLLPHYIFNAETGEWKHKSDKVFKERKWLSSVSYSTGKMIYDKTMPLVQASDNFQSCLKEAEDILKNSAQITSKVPLGNQADIFSEDANHLRWFLLPSEALECLYGDLIHKHQMPFTPKQYSKKNNIEDLSDGDLSKTISSDENDTNLCSSELINKKMSTMDSHCKTNFINRSLKKNSTNISSEISLDKKKEYSTVKFHFPPNYLAKPTKRAMKEYNMIQQDDHVLICLSGGKDSLSLLHVLLWYQHLASKSGVNFSVGAVTVDPQSSAFDPSSLKPYLQSMNVPYFYEEQGIMQHASSLDNLKSICSFCSRMKKGKIYSCARREGYNVIALAHHLDDLAETFLMNAFHSGILQTMKANYTVREGDLRVIRPFVYVREKYTRQFAEMNKLPIISENCPACFESPKERHRTKQYLAQQEILFPNLFRHLRSTLRPLMSINRCGVSIGSILLNNTKNELSDE